MTESHLDPIVSVVARQHVLADLFGVSNNLLRDSQELVEAIRKAFQTIFPATGEGSTSETVTNTSSQNNRFSIVISQADVEVTIHSFPSHHLALIDILAPRQIDLEPLFSVFLKVLQPTFIRKTTLHRGMVE